MNYHITTELTKIRRSAMLNTGKDIEQWNFVTLLIGM